MFTFSSFCLCADASLAKVDKASLSQETLLELVLSKIRANKTEVTGGSTDPFDWINVIQNDTKEVTEIYWDECGILGSILLEWIPSTVQIFSVTQCGLSGTVTLTGLPDAMVEMDLSHNAFEGSVDLTDLPTRMESFNITTNKFCGTVDLTKLPPKMGLLDLSDNLFEGRTDFSQIPKSFEFISVSKTMIEGEIHDFPGAYVGIAHTNVRQFVKGKQVAP